MKNISLFPAQLSEAKKSFKKEFPNGIKKVLFISPPDIHAESFYYHIAKSNRYLNYPTYGFGLLASICISLGIEAKIINLQSAVLESCSKSKSEDKFDFDTAWQSAIPDYEPDLIALTCMFSQTHASFIKVSEFLANLHPNVPQIAGGVHITNSLIQEETYKVFVNDSPFIKLFLLYEADASFKDFLNFVSGQGKDLSQLFIKDIGFFENRNSPTSVDLDKIPAWHLMPPNETSRWGKVGAFYYLVKKDPVTATVIANRGCRASVPFAVSAILMDPVSAEEALNLL